LNSSEIHFLDTNIILAMVLPDDSSYEKSKEYLDYLCSRYISNTVCSESKNKIRKIRRISLKISDYAKKYSMNHQINPLKMDKNLFEVEKNFLKQYKNNPFPEDLKKEKFDDLVSGFFSEYKFEISNILISGDNEELNDNIISSFRISNRKLFNFLNNYTCITFIENMTKYDSLRAIQIDKTDAILLEESYHLHLSLDEIIFFITFDKNILESKSKIKEILTQNVCVSHPNQFT